ncbi:NDR1/HIN1-like protein 2, partial [Cucurbita argyrosperma subsp. argyrosperma]
MEAKNASKCEFSIYIWFLQVLTVLGLASLAIWASLIPKKPIFMISNMDLKPYQNGSASSSLALNVTISNPNKMVGVFFDELNNESVGSSSMSGFYLESKRIDVHEVELGVNGLCGKVDLRVGLVTSVGYKIMWFKTKHRGFVIHGSAHNPDGPPSPPPPPPSPS